MYHGWTPFPLTLEWDAEIEGGTDTVKTVQCAEIRVCTQTAQYTILEQDGSTDAVVTGGLIATVMLLAASRASGFDSAVLLMMAAWSTYWASLGCVRTTIRVSHEDKAVTVTRVFLFWSRRIVYPLRQIKRFYLAKSPFYGGLGREHLRIEMLGGRQRSLTTWGSFKPLGPQLKILNSYIESGTAIAKHVRTG